MTTCRVCAGPLEPAATECPACGTPPPPPPEPRQVLRVEAPRFAFATLDPSDTRPDEGSGGVRGLFGSLADHPLAALILAGAVLAVVAANNELSAAPERGEIQCATRMEAAQRGLLIRPAAILPDRLRFDHVTIPFREAWVGEVAAQQQLSWISNEWGVVGTGRYRLCFSVDRAAWPVGVQLEATDARPVSSEVRVADGKAIVVHHVDVPTMNPGAIEFRVTRPGLAPNLAAHFRVH